MALKVIQMQMKILLISEIFFYSCSKLYHIYKSTNHKKASLFKNKSEPNEIMLIESFSFHIIVLTAQTRDIY